MTFDKVLSYSDIMILPEASLDVGGIKLSTRQLAKAGWVCRVRRKWRSAKNIRVVFSHGNSSISVSISTDINDLEYVFSQIGECVVYSKERVFNLCTFTDLDLLSELRRRNKPVKKRIRNPSNVVKLLDYINAIKNRNVETHNREQVNG